jgi:hypothetical protein
MPNPLLQALCAAFALLSHGSAAQLWQQEGSASAICWLCRENPAKLN